MMESENKEGKQTGQKEDWHDNSVRVVKPPHSVAVLLLPFRVQT